jgi:hypothetical protein
MVTPVSLLRYLLLSLALLKGFVSSYYVGEHVDTTIFSMIGKTEALKAQRPLFGIDSSITFPRSNDRFSLGFEEGFHQLSWFDPTNLGKLRVTFVHSKSGDGAIHSVSSEPIMKNVHDEYSSHHIEIEYMWTEEAPVDLQTGSIVMFLATLVLSLGLILQTCGLTEDSGGDDDDFDENESSHHRDFMDERNSLALHAE